MEIGCGEGGVLKAFLDRGCQGVGIELLKGKAERARDTLKAEISSGQAIVMNKNIYDIDVAADFSSLFDLIILKDVIEHIHDQDAILSRLRNFLKPGGTHLFWISSMADAFWWPSTSLGPPTFEQNTVFPSAACPTLSGHFESVRRDANVHPKHIGNQRNGN